jgi:hypothetical protein
LAKIVKTKEVFVWPQGHMKTSLVLMFHILLPVPDIHSALRLTIEAASLEVVDGAAIKFPSLNSVYIYD